MFEHIFSCFMHEDAKSGRAGCKSCHMNIGQDSLRIGKSENRH
jgi:hypothetical protein